MAYNMAFLWIPDSSTAFENGGAGGNVTLGGTTSYVAGHWAGVNAISYDSAFAIATATGALPMNLSQTGWLAMRVKRTALPSAERRLVRIGEGATNDVIAPYTFTNDIRAHFVTNNATATMTQLSDVIGTGTEEFIYIEWDDTAVGVRCDNSALTTGSRDDPTGTLASTTFRIGAWSSGTHAFVDGTISGIAVGTGTLTTGEIDDLYAATEPWTFDMVPLPTDPPVVSAGADDAVVVNVAWTRAGSFTDADSASWTATVDYDDGDGPESLTLDGTTFDLSHTWTTTGAKTVIVAVTDDSLVTGTDTITVTVAMEDITGGFIVSEIAGTHPTAPRISLT